MYFLKDFLRIAANARYQNLRQKGHASKPEAQAEGIRVCCTKNPIPSARASGFPDFGFTQRNIKKHKNPIPSARAF